MNRQDLPRIRLKVATNAGINILCTAMRTWKVIQWLPHIEQAYREVKEDQEGDEDSKRRFIKAIRIKKGNFYIANSEFIGDIFQDNDQVQCQIAFPQINDKKKNKKQKKADKQIRKQQIQEQNVEFEEQIRNLSANQKPNEVKTTAHSKKKLKQDIHAESRGQKQAQSEKKTKKNKRSSDIKSASLQNEQNQHEKQSEANSRALIKEKLMRGIDFSKLKSILNTKNDSKISHSQEDQVKEEHQANSSYSDDDS